MWNWVLLLCVLACAHAVEVGEVCSTPGHEKGVCRRLKDCPALDKLKARPVTAAIKLEVEKGMQACPLEPKEKNNPGVCCKHTSWSNEPDCGLLGTVYIFGVNETKIGEYPWVALLGYERANRTEFKCGGTLINKRWVLTAAHCISNDLRTVRLGEHDLTRNPDCEESEEDEFCHPDPVDVNVLRTVQHQGFSRKTVANDIALVELETPVEYSLNIGPICLPVGEAGKLNLENKRMIVAGWGRTKITGAKVLMKLEVPVVTLAACNKDFTSKARGTNSITSKQLCAGGQASEDLCNGNSGGPLMMMLSNRWTEFGLVSYGPRKCGTSGIPDVYTRVTEYLQWIGSVVNG